MTTITELNKQKEELQKKIKELLEKEKYIIESMSPNQQLAVTLHEKLCKSNHTVGCVWYYEISNGFHKWDDYSHQQWLKKADRMLETKVSIDDIISIIECINI